MALTPDQLRTVAKTLDMLSKLTKAMYRPIALADQIGAATLEITIGLDVNGAPMTPEQAREIIEWVESEEMQNDLRAWADELEAV